MQSGHIHRQVTRDPSDSPFPITEPLSPIACTAVHRSGHRLGSGQAPDESESGQKKGTTVHECAAIQVEREREKLFPSGRWKNDAHIQAEY